MIRSLTSLAGMALMVALLAGCAAKTLTPDEPLENLGDYKLGHNIVIAPKVKKGPVSREASKEEWTTALTAELAERFERYDGEKLYHFGISVEGYLLAPKGVPLVYSPKSALILNVTIWDDAKGRKLNDKPHQMTIFEDTETDSLLVGSGHSRTKEEQIEMLSFNAARAIEKWMAEQHEDHGWFTDSPTFNPPEKKRETGDF